MLNQNILQDIIYVVFIVAILYFNCSCRFVLTVLTRVLSCRLALLILF